VAEQAAADLAAGLVVGWFQGRMEFGPRSLGNRSILADPRKAEMKDRINLLVKFREGFRPFTPSVAEEAAGEFFKDIKISPYMTQTYDVQPDKRAVIPAVTHVDGSARVQTVSRKYNPRYHALISEFGRLTGVPVVLNTSLNLMGQPIAAHPRAALANFYSTGMDRMALGSWYLSK
jgi:carbamoyltransferase